MVKLVSVFTPVIGTEEPNENCLDAGQRLQPFVQLVVKVRDLFAVRIHTKRQSDTCGQHVGWRETRINALQPHKAAHQ